MVDQHAQADAFPRLDEAQIQELARFARRQTFSDGQTLFEAGERGFKFFVVLSGQVEIVDNSGDRPRTVTVHGPREFTGDVDMLTGRPAAVRRSRTTSASPPACRAAS